MPNTKEVEQEAEALFRLPDNPDSRSLKNIDVVINCRNAFKAGYHYALSNPLEQSEKKEEWVSVETVILVAMGFNQSVYNNTTYFFHKDIVEINLKVYGNTYWVRFRDQDIKPIKNIGDLKSTVFAMTGKTL